VDLAGATASAPRQLARRPTRHRTPLPGDPGAAPFRPARREQAPPAAFSPTTREDDGVLLRHHHRPLFRNVRHHAAASSGRRNWATVRAREMSRVSPGRRKAKVYGGGGGGGTSAVCCGLYRVRVRALARVYYYYYCNTVTDRARAANVIFSRYSARVGSLRTDGRTNELAAGGGNSSVTVAVAAAVDEDAPGETGLSSGPAVEQTHPIREQHSLDVAAHYAHDARRRS